MTEKDQFIAMLKRAGVKYETRTLNDGGVELSIQTESASPHALVQGYACFEASFKFSEEGQLRNIGIWE